MQEKQVTVAIKALTNDVAEKAGLTKAGARMAIDAVIASIIEHTNAGAKVAVTGLGTFRLVSRPERVGRNPQTGEPTTVAASTKLSFKPVKRASK